MCLTNSDVEVSEGGVAPDACKPALSARAKTEQHWTRHGLDGHLCMPASGGWTTGRKHVFILVGTCFVWEPDARLKMSSRGSTCGRHVQQDSYIVCLWS